MKTSKIYNIIFLLFIVLFLSSCESYFMTKDPEDTPEENFQYLWETVDHKYSFFEFKKIDWNQVYSKYHQKIDDDMTDEELFRVLFDMLSELRDAHVNLWSPFDVSRYERIFLNSPQNFDYDLLKRNYLFEDYRYTGSLINKKIDNIGYIYYGSFSNPITEDDLDYVLNQFTDCDGIILDVRDNGGGNPYNSYILASRFADKKRHVYTTKLKSGKNHNSFTEPNEVYISPSGNSYNGQPVCLLTNRSCYSATNMFTAQMAAFPNVILIGDTTGGGGGMPIGGELPNGWGFRFSASQTLLPNGFNIEDGIPPDIAINMDANDKLKGKDSILEFAIALIKKTTHGNFRK